MTENKNLHDINTQVYMLLEDLTSFGMKSAPRGKKVVEANVATLEIDPMFPLMDFEDRAFNWKYFTGELAWYLKRSTDISFINKFSSFWNNIAINGNVNSNYGNILLDDHPSTILNNSVNQLEWAFKSLVHDKDTRQAVAFLNCPYYQTPGNKDFVCTMYLNFWIRHDRLDMKVQMRSNDIFFGLSYDAPWFALIQQSMYLNLKNYYPNLKLGMYYHCADNIHYYERHFDLVEKIVNKPVTSSPKIELLHPLFYFYNGKLSLSAEAIAFKNGVEDLFIKNINGKRDLMIENMKSDEDWKTLLKYLIYIGDDATVSNSIL